MMKLITKSIATRLEKRWQNSEKGIENDNKFVCKFFNPAGSQTWLVSEGQKQPNGDWRLFGKASLGYGFAEYGYFMLSDIESLRIPIKMMGRTIGYARIERDKYYDGEDELKDL